MAESVLHLPVLFEDIDTNFYRRGENDHRKHTAQNNARGPLTENTAELGADDDADDDYR